MEVFSPDIAILLIDLWSSYLQRRERFPPGTCWCVRKKKSFQGLLVMKKNFKVRWQIPESQIPVGTVNQKCVGQTTENPQRLSDRCKNIECFYYVFYYRSSRSLYPPMNPTINILASSDHLFHP